ncbi:accessory factor UbiK family protein [Orrella sp. 11846]|uniref:accessory factor UbiK family protein n=1 Tax=Orrella sp. 11846 TaxID=3409913 RepID=UPI003B59E414
MQSNPWFEAFQKNVSDLIARSPAADVERNVRAFMTQSLSKLDLVTREEFDIQADMLQVALTKIDQLDKQIQALELRVTSLENARD